MKPQKQPTLQDIADRAGVSRMTVSLALRNDPRIAAKTRRRLQKLAEEMGYRRNPLVSVLMSNIRARREIKNRVLLAFIAHKDYRQSPVLANYMDGARNRAEELGYQLEPFWIDDKASKSRRLSRILFNRGISGLVVSPMPSPNQSLALEWSLFATAVIGHPLPGVPLNRAVHHQFQGISEALARLHDLGYRRPGLALSTEQDERVEHNWLGGFLAHQRLLRFEKVPVLLAGLWDRPTFSKWFLRHRPDAIISMDENVLHWLEHLEVKVPGDAGFAHLNWEKELGEVAGIDQDSRSIGAGAVDLVVAQLHRNERGVPAGAKVVLIEGKWHPAGTVRRIPPNGT